MIGLGLGVGAAIGGIVVAHGSFHRNSRVFASPLSRLPAASRPRVALTFDDGPNPEATPRVLDELADAGAKATFFVLGKHAERWPSLVRRIVAEGHSLGSHGYHHQRLAFRGPTFTRRDLTLGGQAVTDAAGEPPKFFRAPHGSLNPWVETVARELGQRVVGWTLGVWDTDRPGADVIAHRVITGADDGAIVLLHDGDGYDVAGDRTQTAAALPRMIDGLRDRGFNLATVPVT
jgi:peptidoglycan/xylan/chitin deacetylase (PgdA/CDA1 family)